METLIYVKVKNEGAIKSCRMSVEVFIDTLYNSLFWISLLTFILIIGYIIYREIVKK